VSKIQYSLDFTEACTTSDSRSRRRRHENAISLLYVIVFNTVLYCTIPRVRYHVVWSAYKSKWRVRIGHRLAVDVNKSGPVTSRSGKWRIVILEQWLPWLHSLTRPPLPFITLSASHHHLSSNPYSLQCTSRPSLLSLGSHRPHLDFRSSNLSNATTASTKTFVTALALNGIITGVELVAFTVVWRYFRLIYEPRSLSVFES